MKRIHGYEEAAAGCSPDEDMALLHAKKMMTAQGLAAQYQMAPSSASNSMCSTPATAAAATLLQHQQLMGMYAPYQQSCLEMQLQQPMASTLEGIPIFVVPPNGPPTIPLSALQRAAEFKAALASIPTEPKIDTSKHFHLFVGDLSPEVDNKMLKDAFSTHGEVSEAKVIRDGQTQKSKGYGFVSFPAKENAEKAVTAMNGQWVGRRAVRTNWATRKSADENREKLTFEQVFNSTKPDNTSVYVGNVHPITTENDLREFFAGHGEITEVRLFKAQGYAFVRYEKKECATHAIMEMNGKELGGNTIRCSWGRVQNNQCISTPLLPDLSSLLAPAMLQQPIPNMFYNPYLTPQMYNPSLVQQW